MNTPAWNVISSLFSPAWYIISSLFRISSLFSPQRERFSLLLLSFSDRLFSEKFKKAPSENKERFFFENVNDFVPIFFFIKSDFTNYFADFRGHYDCITLILPGIILKFVSFHDFSHQRCLGRLLAALTAQAALMGKIMEGDNFQNYGMVQGRISIYAMWLWWKFSITYHLGHIPGPLTWGWTHAREYSRDLVSRWASYAACHDHPSCWVQIPSNCCKSSKSLVVFSWNWNS